MKRIIFVCSGNICRSPMAAGLARHKLVERNIEGVVISGGTLNLKGHHAAQAAIIAMEEVGIDISEHYSQGISAPMLNVADTIIVMAPEHEDVLRRAVPKIGPKIVRIWQWADEELEEIEDPVGKSLDHFRQCRDLLNQCLERWMDDAL